MKLISLFDCQNGPAYRGLSSRKEPAAAPQGAFTEAVNVRCDSGAIEVRQGTALFQGLAPPVAGGECLGGCVVPLGEITLALAAVFDPSVNKTKVFRCRYNGAWGPWLEVTGSGQQWGDTRMARSSRGLVQFLPLAAGDGRVRVLIQSGAGDLPRVYTAQPESLVTAHPVEPPQWAEVEAAAAFFPHGLNVAGAQWAAAAGGPSGQPFAIHFRGSHAEGTQYLEFTGASASAEIGEGEWAAASLATGPGISLAESNQLILVCAWQGENEPWSKLKLEAGQPGQPSASWHVLHDPAERRLADTLGPAVFESPEGDEFRLAAFALDNAKGLVNAAGIRITAAAPLAAGFSLKVAWVAASGGIPGSAQFAVSFLCPQSGVESAGVVLNSAAFRESANQDWLSRAAAAWDKPITAKGDAGFPGMLRRWPGAGGAEAVSPRLPVVPGISYCFAVPAACPSAEEGAKGVSQAVLYRRDAGETEFTEQRRVGVAAWTGQWIPLAGEGNWEGRIPVLVEGRRTEERSFASKMPDPGCTGPPAGHAMVQANGRLYIGAPRGAADGASEDAEEGAVWVSEQDKPLRFREVARMEGGIWDDRAAHIVSTGPRPVTALLASASGPAGMAAVFAWTDQAMYRLDGLRAERTASHGAWSPSAAAERNGQMVWLDCEMGVMEAPGLRDLARQSVDNFLKGPTGIPAGRQAFACCTHWSDRWLLAFTPHGEAANTSVLVWNRSLGLWESCDRLAGGLAVVQWQEWQWNGSLKRLFWTPQGRLAEWDSGTSDAGSPISFALRTPEFFGPLGGQLRCRRGLVFAEPAPPGASLAIQRIVRGPNQDPNGDPVEGLVGLASTGLTHAYDTGPGGEPAGAQGQAMKFRLHGELPGGWSLFRWGIEAEGMELGAVKT